ncbi:MAG: FtsQ-type POTRA domain-containing protein [Anaerolineae bacterium]|nr:FtsQ-type POTRA domain-containing protein [Anaerolineae bacterium]
MTSRLRERRRGTTRTPGILRTPGITSEVAERPVQHSARRSMASWRIISALIVFTLLGVLALFFVTPFFYIHSIAVGGLRYVTKEEVFALTNVANMHIFWIDPDEVRRSVLRSPTIADATVTVGWPPNMVQVLVKEREPAVVWMQSSVSTWVDVQGRVMQQREERKDLVKIESNDSEGPLGPNVQVPLNVVAGALQLKNLRPNIETLTFDQEKGLGYRDGRGWEAWFGTGTDMPEKLIIYETLVANLLSRNLQPLEVNVVNPDAPYYSVLGGR